MSTFSEGYEGVTHAGLAVVRRDGGTSVLLAQRTMDETDDPAVQESWEMPGGGLKDGEDPFEGAKREFTEEIGFDLPEGEVITGWRSENGVYQGFVYEVASFPATNEWVATDEVQAVGWFTKEEAASLRLRPEMEQFDWGQLEVSGNRADEGDEMDDETLAEEPILTMADVMLASIPIHGVLAPEDAESGDSRGFNAGSMTSRPYRLPFRHQKSDIGGHNGAIVVGSVDRLMRKDGLIHWQGLLMPSEDASEFAELLAFFGRFGVSVDGDKGTIDAERTEASGVLWFDAVRAAGLTAVAIPAFAEAYVAFGPHPDMPDEDDPEFAVMTASGSMVTFAGAFDRGPGWVTNPKETKRLHDFWTKKGQPGYAKIRWGTPGDFTRAKKLIGEKIGANSPEDLRYLNQIIAQWHYDALGYWPGELDKPGNKTSAEARAEREARLSGAHATFSIDALPEDDPIRGEAYCSAGCGTAAEFIVSTNDKQWFALYCADHATEYEDKEIPGWEAVLTSSGRDASPRALPPMSYFDKHPDTGALVIEDPDENGLRRTYGYAGEWGVCHIGFDGDCVEVPRDPTGEYAEFHLGRTRVQGEVSGNEYLNTGLITYKVDHRDAQTILSQTAEQQHFDNVAHAWAAVRLGQDESGVWFSGVVLPGIPEEDLVLIEAAGQVSGEWKYGALRALQAVNVPGFPVMRSSAVIAEDGTVEALVACAYNTHPCGESPADRMAALALVCQETDAEVRFAQLRAGFMKSNGGGA